MVVGSFWGGPKRDFLSLVAFLYILLSLVAWEATANVVLIGKNASFSFDDIEANFAPSIKGSDTCGVLKLAEPVDACLPLTNKVVPAEGTNSSLALIVRGGCTFEYKVRTAQKAGFKAAIVFDNEDDGILVSMAGNPGGIKIHAVFVSKASGEILKKYVGFPDMVVWIIPTFENSAWSIIAIAFISLLAMSAVLATCFFVRRHRIRRERPQTPRVREFHGMSKRLVKAMPSLIFTSVLEDNCTSTTCAICLEDYAVGEKLRVLPCRHKFHAICVDSWLTTWRTFCPVCKRDARTSSSNPPASEYTPLLSSGPSSPSSAELSSFRSSLASSFAIRIGSPASRSQQGSFVQSLSSTPGVPLASSSAIRIGSPASRSQQGSRVQSLSSTPGVPHSFRSYTNSPGLSISRSSVDLRNASSQRSHTSYFISPHSLGFPSTYSPLNSRYPPPYIPSSSNASPSCAGSSSRPTFLRHCSESAGSMSPFASAQSLPGC